MSKATCEEFGRTVQQKVTELETLCMVEIKTEDAEGLVEIVQSCKGVGTFKELRLIFQVKMSFSPRCW